MPEPAVTMPFAVATRLTKSSSTRPNSSSVHLGVVITVTQCRIVLVPPGRPANGNAALAPATPSAPPNNRLPARFFLSFGQELKSLKLRRLSHSLLAFENRGD